MRVYRYLSEQELNTILHGDVSSLGHEFHKDRKNYLNSHHYKKGVKYMHFFKEFENMQEIKQVYQNVKGKFYYCTFDIPRLVLFFAAGKGFYAPKGYDYDFSVMTEYAIRTDKFNPQWLHSYSLDKDREKPKRVKSSVIPVEENHKQAPQTKVQDKEKTR